MVCTRTPSPPELVTVFGRESLRRDGVAPRAQRARKQLQGERWSRRDAAGNRHGGLREGGAAKGQSSIERAVQQLTRPGDRQPKQHSRSTLVLPAECDCSQFRPVEGESRANEDCSDEQYWHSQQDEGYP